MYGKHYESMYEGSMVGAGSDVFAVWGYVIAKARDGIIDLNPVLLSAVLGMDLSDVEMTITRLCQPDPNSHCQEAEGARLVKQDGFAYFVPAHQYYRDLKTAADRREYNRIKQAEYRKRQKDAKNKD